MRVYATLHISKLKLNAYFYIPTKYKEKLAKFRKHTVFVSCNDFSMTIMFAAKIHVSMPHKHELFTYNIPKRFVPFIVDDIKKNTHKDKYTLTITDVVRPDH